MRLLFERVVSSLRLDPRSRRVLDETLGDWRHEDESGECGLRHWVVDIRSAWSVARALILVSWWKPNSALAQTANGAPLSARDEVIDVINKLSPDSSYEDILRELARVRASKGEPGMAAKPPSKFDPSFWGRAVRVAVLCLVASVMGAAIQTYGTRPMYMGMATVRAEPDTVHSNAAQRAQTTVDPAAFMLTENAVLQSRQLKLRVVRKLQLAGAAAAASDTESPAEAQAIDELSESLVVSAAPVAYTFTIRYSSPSPQVAAQVANAMAEEYVTLNLVRKLKSVGDQLQTVQNMAVDMQIALEGDRRNLIRRTAAAKVIDEAIVAANVAAAQRAYDARQYEADARRVTAEEMKRFDLETPNGLDGALSHPDLISAVTSERLAVTETRNNLTATRSRGYGAASSQVKQAEAAVASAQFELKSAVQRHVDAAQNAYATAEAQRVNAEKALTYQKALAVENSSNLIPFATLRERISANQRSYEGLLQQQNQLEILVRGVTNNVSIAERASVPRLPYTPHTIRNFAVWLVAGLVAAALALFVMTRRPPARPALAV